MELSLKDKYHKFAMIVKDIENNQPYLGSVTVSVQHLFALDRNKLHKIRLPLC